MTGVEYGREAKTVPDGRTDGLFGASRRSFLAGGLASLGCGLFGGRIFAAPPGWTPAEEPNLVLGAVSDTHLRTAADGRRMGANWRDTWFTAALKYFRAQNVDAVVHCGDFAHRGQVREMEFHAAAWNRVFPNGLAPDGHRVEKLFVNGNHDVEGGKYGVEFRADKIYPDPDELAKHLLVTDMAGHWRRIWGEPFEDVWHKTVKGYHFFGRHYGVDELKMARFVRATARAEGLVGTKPFFLLSHVRPHARYLRWLARYRNAVGFFGHWHHSASDWNSICFWKEATFPNIQVPSCEPRGSGVVTHDGFLEKAEILGEENVGKCRQGYVVRVYDDKIVISRREFGEGGSLGPDWVMPIGKYDPHPFSKGELKKVIGAPQFGKDAKLAVCRAGDVKMSIPNASGNPKCRVYAYEVRVEALEPSGGDGGMKPTGRSVVKGVYAAGCNMGIGHEANGGVTELSIPKAQLPQGGTLSFAVRPLSSLGTAGRPISAISCV